MLTPVTGIVFGELVYDVNSPLEVKLSLNVSDGTDTPVEWVFARSLLRDGLISDSGMGDVQIMPVKTSTGYVIMLEFAGVDVLDRESSMTLVLAWSIVEKFLCDAYTEVPPDAERLLVEDMVDSTIQQILGA